MIEAVPPAQQKLNVVDDRVEFRRMLSLKSNQVKLSSRQSMQKRENRKVEEAEEVPENMKRLVEQCEVMLKIVQNSCIMVEDFLNRVRDSTVVTEKHRQRLGNQKRVLEIRQTQLFMVLYIIENRKKPNFTEQYSKLFTSLQRFRIADDHVSYPINYRMLDSIHSKQLTYLRFYERNLSELISHSNDCDFGYVNFKVKRCKVLISKIYTCAEMYPFGCVVSHDDLFSEDLNHSKRWAQLKKVMTIRILGDKKAIQAGFGVPIEGMNLINAMMSKVNQLSNSIDATSPENFFEVLKGGFHVLNYAVVKEKAQRRAELFLSDPDKVVLMDIWNLPESNLARPFLNLVMPSIQYMQMIYIPRHFPQLNFDKIQEWADKKSFNASDQPELQIAPLTDIRNYTRKLFDECEDQNLRIQVRVMSPITIERVMKERPSLKDLAKKLFNTKPKPINKIIMHVHGGGFISQTSFFHQLYTRNWANNIGVPIYSVDYRLAPDHPYPAALDDCFQVYMWLTSYLKKVFDVNPEDIVLVGDSAGGNIITALTGLLIKLKQKLPAGLVLIYPTLNLTFNSYSPSLLASLDDCILPHTYLKFCLSSYIPENRRASDDDPFASPIKFGDEILKHFPPTRMFIGNKDPFHDDNCRLAQRLMKLNKDVRLTVYDNFTHAFLQLEFPLQQLIYSRIAVNEIEAALKQVLNVPVEV